MSTGPVLGRILASTTRCRANMAHTRQSRPDPGLGFQVKFLTIFELFPLCSEADWRTGLESVGAVRIQLSARFQEQLLSRNVKQFPGRLVFKAHRLLFHSFLGSRMIEKKKTKNLSARPLAKFESSHNIWSHSQHLIPHTTFIPLSTFDPSPNIRSLS